MSTHGPQQDTMTITMNVAAAKDTFVTAVDVSGELRGTTSTAAGDSIGTLLREAFAIGDQVAVLLAEPTRNAVAGGAVAIGDKVQVGAGGKVTTNVAGTYVALNATAADGDMVVIAKIVD